MEPAADDRRAARSTSRALDHRAIVDGNRLARPEVYEPDMRRRRQSSLSHCAITALADCGESAGSTPGSAWSSTGRGPCGIAARAGSIWVGVYGTGQASRARRAGRDACETSVARRALGVQGRVGPAAVWVTRDRAGELVRISRGTGRIERLQVGSGTFDVLISQAARSGRRATTRARSRGSTPRRPRVTRVFKDGAIPGRSRALQRSHLGRATDGTRRG